jgi:hypothetical protein
MFVAKADKSSPVILQQHVVKHGSHDQSSHSPKKGGGRVGGGVGTSGQSHMGEAISEAQDDIANRIKGAESLLGRSRQAGTRLSGAGQDRIKGTIKGFQDAGSLIGKPKELSKLKSDMVRAKKDVLSPSVSLADAQYVNGYADAVISVHSQYGNLERD